MTVRDLLFSALYKYISRVDRAGEITLMNFGYLEDDGVTRPPEPDFDCSENLYRRAVRGIDLTGKTLLETGCGRGGGLAFVHRTFRPLQSHGIDPEPAAIGFCSSRHRLAGLLFSTGDAQALAFPAASFDCVLNVESSHRYPDMAAFVSQAFRVLKPGGLLAITDFRFDHEMEGVRMLYPAAGFEPVRQDDITGQVVAALAHDDGRRRALVDKHVPRPFRGLALNFAGAAGSQTHEAFRSRAYVYFSDIYRKPG